MPNPDAAFAGEALIAQPISRSTVVADEQKPFTVQHAFVSPFG
jgi:hypothetical protein